MANDLLDAVYGCLIGGAIGDALGAPVEGLYYPEIRAQYGRVTELVSSPIGNTGPTYGGSTGDLFREEYDGPPCVPGAITDDTALAHYMCLAIVRKNGRITPDDFARVWVEELNPNRFWVNERIIRRKLRAGINPWEAGRGSIPAGCATMAIAPIGIINAGHPAQAYQDGFVIASVNQDGVNRDAAATLAAGVAAAFSPGATVQSVLETMTAHSSYLVRRAIELTMHLATASDSVDEFAAKFYEKMLDWSWPWPPTEDWDKDHHFSGNSIEIVPATMAIVYLCQGEANESIIEGASFGRDCDTIGRAAGCLAGALCGASAIRQDWIETVEKASEEFFEEMEGDPKANFYSMAQRLVAALRAERQAAQDRASVLDEIIG
jgi:ADP-ribosylglycohydrolase